MNPRTTGLLALVVLGLGGFIYFYEIGAESTRQAAIDDAKRFFSGVSEADVEAVTLVTEDAVEARFERHEGRWQLVSPLSDRADAAALDGIVSALVRLSPAGSVDRPGGLAEYGVESGARVVRFEVGGEEKGIRIGRPTPVGGHVYVAMLGSDDVAYVETFRTNPWKRRLADLRDRRIFPFDVANTSDIATLRISWVDGGERDEVALARDRAGDWQMGVPIATRADSQTLRELLENLAHLRAKEFVDVRNPAVEAALASPWLTIHWTLAGDHFERSAMIGGLVGADRILETGNGRLYRIDAVRANDFERTIDAYRFKMLSEFEVSAARRIVLDFAPVAAAEEAGGAAAAENLRIVSRLVEEGWSGEAPQLNPVRALELVQTLSSLRAEDIFVEEMGPSELKSLGLAPPRVAIRIEDRADPAAESRVLADIAIGRLDPKRGLFVKRTGEPTIYLLPASRVEDLPTSREAFSRDFERLPDGAEIEGEELDPADLESDPLEGIEIP
jgi:hypothetical protein